MRLIIATFFLLNFVYLPTYSVSVSELEKMVDCSPKKALAYLDSLESTSLYPLYKLNYLRAYAYYSLSMFNHAQEYAKSILASEEILSDPQLYKKNSLLLSNLSVYTYSLKDALKNISDIKQYAQSANDELILACVTLAEGSFYRRIGMLYKSYDLILTATQKLSVRSDIPALYSLSHAYGLLMLYYMQDNDFKTAWSMGNKRRKVLEKLKKKDSDLYKYDRQIAYFYGKMAYLANLMGKKGEAEEYYHRFFQTHFSTTNQGRMEINDYLLSQKEYGLVVSYTNAYFQEIGKQDTLHLYYVRALQQASLAYEALGNYKDAYYTAKRRSRILQLMRMHNERNQLIEMADLSTALHTKDRLVKTESRLKSSNFWVILFSCLSFLLLLRLAWKQRMIYMNHKRMADLMLENEKQKQQLNEPKTASSTGIDSFLIKHVRKAPPVVSSLSKERSMLYQMPDKELFCRFNQKVHNDRLYLDYQLGRDDYARIMKVDKNRFATILKEQSGMNLANYLNSLRLEHSVGLFRRYPDKSINEIALQSGIPNVSTFYRLFKDKYGMSPSAFRLQIHSGEKGDPTIMDYLRDYGS